MHRNDKSNFLLYIEPKASEKLEKPIIDEVTSLIELAFQEATRGSANYDGSPYPDYIIEKFGNSDMFREGSGFMGTHRTECGERSDNHDYQLKNGLIVNSLCVFYVKWYRNSIHENDWMKLKQLGDYYDVDINLPDVFPNSSPTTEKDTIDPMQKIQDVMVEALAKDIEKNIIERLKEYRDGQK